MMKQAKVRNRIRWSMAAIALCLIATLPLPAYAAGGLGQAAEGLIGLLSIIVVLAASGLAVGAFSLVVNNIFPKRSAVTYKVLRMKPGLSLLAGVLVTAVGIGLLAVTAPIPALPGLVLLGFLLGLGQFAIGAAGRLATAFVDPLPENGELPDARAHLKGGLLLVGVNAVPFLGSILFFGILLAAVGATLIGYFSGIGTSIGRVAAPPPPAAPTQPQPPPPAPPPAPAQPQPQPQGG